MPLATQGVAVCRKAKVQTVALNSFEFYSMGARGTRKVENPILYKGRNATQLLTVYFSASPYIFPLLTSSVLCSTDHFPFFVRHVAQEHLN